MERRFKGLVAINDVLDDRYQKLSDKYHSLELSHKRKKECLKWIRKQFTPPETPVSGVTIPITSIFIMLQQIDNALFCDGRERQKSVKKKKTTMATVKARKHG